jgi:hypothetical protein
MSNHIGNIMKIIKSVVSRRNTNKEMDSKELEERFRNFLRMISEKKEKE